MNNLKHISVIILIALAIIVAFAIPKPEYKGVNILKQLNIPAAFVDWTSQDVGQNLNLNDDRYNFISDIFARTYTRKDGANLLFLIIDAGNFHDPKVCFGNAGYKLTDLGYVDFDILNRQFKAIALLTEKSEESYVVVYWFCIDKNITGWGKQKLEEFLASIMGRKKSGLMIRFDIPCSKSMTIKSTTLGKEFIYDLARALTHEDIEFIFGLGKN